MFPSAHLLQSFSLCIVTDHFLRQTLFLHLKFNMLTVIVKVLNYQCWANDMSNTMLTVAANKPNNVKGITFLLKHWLHYRVVKDASSGNPELRNLFFSENSGASLREIIACQIFFYKVKFVKTVQSGLRGTVKDITKRKGQWHYNQGWKGQSTASWN